MPEIRRAVTRIEDADDFSGEPVAGVVPLYTGSTFEALPVMTIDEAPASFEVPSGWHCVYPGLSVAPGVVVSVAGTLLAL